MEIPAGSPPTSARLYRAAVFRSGEEEEKEEQLVVILTLSLPPHLFYILFEFLSRGKIIEGKF